MKKSKSIEIQINESTTKSFVVHELTVGDLIELTQNNPFFGAEEIQDADEKETLIEQLGSIGEMTDGVLKKSCEFARTDLLELAPSDIDVIFKGWQEVNQTFLDLLKKMGLQQALEQILEKGISDFLRTVAI